jgi:hypothetical protein
MKHFILASALLLSCSQVFAKTYVLKKGKHGGIHLAVKLNDFAEQRVRFDESSTYQTKDPKNQGDINKLFGFSDCYSFHQKNSARFGWRWYNDNLEIHAYSYVKGKRDSKFIQKIDQNKYYDMRIETDGSEYVFSIDGQESVRLPRGCSQKFNVKYKLYPYFGGDETAPHDIRIELD